MKKVFNKNTEGLEDEFLGEYLNIIPITRSTNCDEIVTQAMVYYIQDDGYIGVADRCAIIIKDDRIPYYPNDLDESKIIENLENMENFGEIDDITIEDLDNNAV